MDKKKKIDLYKRGVFRTVVNAGLAAGLSCISPENAGFFLIGGYMNVFFSLEFTNYKIKEHEKWEETQKSLYYRDFYLHPENYTEPHETAYEVFEKKAIDKIALESKQIKKEIKCKLNEVKKSKFVFKIGKLNDKQTINQTLNENELNK